MKGSPSEEEKQHHQQKQESQPLTTNRKALKDSSTTSAAELAEESSTSKARTGSNEFAEDGSSLSSGRRRMPAFPVVTTPKRGLGGASSSSDEEEELENVVNGNKLLDENSGNTRIPSFHNSRGIPVGLNGGPGNTGNSTNSHSSTSTNNANGDHSSSSNATGAAAASVSADQERQILLLMLLAQVCALHDPTPRTFTVHVLELFERGILGRQSIHFLFELGLVPPTTARLLPPSTTNATQQNTSNDDSKEEIFDLATVPSSTTPVSPQALRAREASAIRSSLEQHDIAQAQQRLAKDSPKDFTTNTLVASPVKANSDAPQVGADATSWSVEHHPLSLSRYQREFHQRRLLNSGSFGEVFQSTNKIDLKDYAVKRVAFSAWGYSKDSVSQVIREVHCLAQCDHPNVVRYYTSWLEPSWMTGSGATSKMMASTGKDVRRQQKLLTDIQHMMLTGAPVDECRDHSASESWGRSSLGVSNSASLSPSAAVLVRDRKFSIGSSMDDASVDSFVSAGSSYEESSSDGEVGQDYTAWSVEESCVLGSARDDSDLFIRHKKEVWEASSSAPRHDRHGNDPMQNKKKQQQSAGPTRLKYRYQICLFIQMQLCHPATLGDWIRHRNSEIQNPDLNRQERVETAVKIFRQIVGGLNHIHYRGIVHRDLKPMNVFRSLEHAEVFLIGDFGLSKLIHSATHHQKTNHKDQPVSSGGADGVQALIIHPPVGHPSNDGWQDPLTAGVGTASYAAPEQVTTRTYGKAADIFSLGLMLLEMLCCFSTEHERIQTFNDCRNRRDVPTWITEEYPAAGKTILACTNPIHDKRPTAEELLKVDLLLKPVEEEIDPPILVRTDGDLDYGRLHELDQELQRKNALLLAYERQLEEKDRTIKELRQEVVNLKQLQAENFPKTQVTSETFDAAEVASSSSSSSDGVV